MAFQFPNYITHYYRKYAFRSLTAFQESERDAVIADLDFPPNASHRFRSTYYFEQRARFESRMHKQFVKKGGQPKIERPHYAVLGESDIWQEISVHSIRIPLDDIAEDEICFTYTDSWFAYVRTQEDGTAIPRKPQYEMVYRLGELTTLFAEYGWPGDRWKSEPGWENDVYVEAQIWNDSIKRYVPTERLE